MNRLAVKTCSGCEDSDVSKVSPCDVTDHVMASARRGGGPGVKLCSPQSVDTAWTLLATHGYRQRSEFHFVLYNSVQHFTVG